MKEIIGDLWEQECDAICITTNGFVKQTGYCVMGRGCAKEATQRYPKIGHRLGSLIRKNGSAVYNLKRTEQYSIVSFPVKPVWREYNVAEDIVKHMRNKFTIGQRVPGWASTAILSIIKQSAIQLVELTDKSKWEKVVIPRPGCGAGELNWNEVKEVLSPILDDRFSIITY